MSAEQHIREGAGLGGGKLYLLDSVPSTNSWAMHNLDSLNAGDVVTALEQTKGKGRRTRMWLTPVGGLAISVVLEYPEEAMQAPVLGQTAALAVALWLESEGIDARIKWPNDVLVDHRKIAGILSEARPAAGKAVVGIGLNVNVDEQVVLQWQARWPATSLSIETEEKWELDSVRQGLLDVFSTVLKRLDEDGFQSLSEDWARLDALTDMNLVVDTGESRLEGQYGGIDENGQLILIRGKKTPPINVGDVVAIYKKSG
ncbi:biotin--[acetyl-CoA-carboxylase] ligase [bacterium]|nr:biotin--[acetyl-CoA-carboxylase] ligase [bacterium]